MISAEKFWSRVDKENGPVHPVHGRCWVWTGCVLSDGYGQLAIGDRTRDKAHRVAWHFANGPIGGGLWVLHKCDHRSCCNPVHLFLGTALDNIRDAKAKRRNAHGVTHQEAKINDATVLEIDRLRDLDGLSFPAIGRIVGLDKSATWQAYKRRTWRHVPKRAPGAVTPAKGTP